MVGLVLVLAGCASQPKEAADAAFTAYWRCAYAAAMTHTTDTRMEPHAAAMRAQAACNPAYETYRAQKTRYVRSVVPDSERAMASSLADNAALQRRKEVTRRLTEIVAEARR